MVKLIRPPVRKIVTKPAAGGLKPAKANTVFSGTKKAKVKPGGAFAQADIEKKKADLARSMPFGVSVPVGGSLEVYLLDKGEPWTRYEHNIGGSKTSRGKTYPCIKDGNEPCPACAKTGKEGAFVMYYTCVVPKDEYTTKDNEKVVRRFQKKLFPIKIKMSAQYGRLFEKHGSLRGLVLRLHRDGQMDPATGSSFEELKTLPEAMLRKYAAAADIKGEQGDLIRKAKIDEPFDYEKIMPRPSAKELAAMIGMHSDGTVGNSDFDSDDAPDADW